MSQRKKGDLYGSHSNALYFYECNVNSTSNADLVKRTKKLYPDSEPQHFESYLKFCSIDEREKQKTRLRSHRKKMGFNAGY